MDEKQKKFLEEIFLPGLTNLREKLSLTEEETSMGPLNTKRGPFAFDDFEILLKSFLTLFQDSSLKSKLLKDFNLKDPDFVDLLLRLLTRPATSQEKELVNKMPPPDQLAQLIKAQQLSEKLKKEIREEAQERMAQLKARFDAQRNNLQEKLSLKLSSQEFEIPPPQVKVLSKEVIEVVESLIAEVPPHELPSRLPERTTRLFINFNLPRERAERLAPKLFEPEGELSGIIKKMAERIKEAWENYSLTHRQEKLGLLLAVSLPEEIIEDRSAFAQITKNLAQREFNEKEEFVAAVQGEVKKVNPKLIGKINTKGLTTALSPCSFYCPKAPLFIEAPETRKMQQTLEETITEGLKETEYQPSIRNVAQQVIEAVGEEKILDELLSLEAEKQKEVFIQILERAFRQERLILPEEKRGEVFGKIVEKALPNLLPFLSHQQERMRRLREGLEKIETSPIGVIADVIGVFSQKAKRSLLVGFFGGDEKTLRQLKDHYQGLEAKEKEKAEFAKRFLGETEEFNQLNRRAKTLERTAMTLEGMEKEVKKPSFLSRPFLFGGNNLRKAVSFVSRKTLRPLSIFADIKKIDFSRFLPSFLPSLSANLKKLSGGFLYQRFPGLFIKDPLGTPIFKLSLGGARISLGGFFGKIRRLFGQKILGSSFIQGAKALGGKLLSKLGLGGLAKIGLSLGVKALGAGLSAGTTLLLEGGLRLAKGAFSLLTGGLGGAREEKKGLIASLGEDLPLVGALVGIGAVVLVFFLSLFSMFQAGSSFISWPHNLPQREEKKTLGAMGEKITTPSATPTTTPLPIFKPQ